MSKQNIKLAVMFVLGLPGTPITLIAWLMDIYLYNGKPWDKEFWIANSLAYTVFFGGLIILYWKTNGFR